MSLKGGISHTELLNAIDDAKKGKKKAIEKLAKYVEDGRLSREEFGPLIMHCRINKAKKDDERLQKIKDAFCGIASSLILLGSMATTLGEIVVRHGKGIAVPYLFLWLWAFEYVCSTGTKR